MKKKPTAKQVAKLTNVSVVTVSRAFNLNSTISEKTRNKVFNSSIKLGYQIDKINSFKENRKDTHFTAIIVNKISESFASRNLSKLVDYMQQNKLIPLVFKIKDLSEARERVDKLIKQNISNIVFLTDDFNIDNNNDNNNDSKAPLAIIKPTINNGPLNKVYLDYAIGIKQSLTLMFKNNKRNLLILTGPSDFSSSITRKKVIEKILENYQFNNIKYVDCNYKYKEAFNCILEVYIGSHDIKYDAIFSFNDLMAIGAIDALKRLNIKIPQSVNIVGFDNIEMAGWDSYNLTTIGYDTEKYVKNIVEVILNNIENPNISLENECLKTFLIIRDTI